jgi:hypothetical protein
MYVLLIVLAFLWETQLISMSTPAEISTIPDIVGVLNISLLQPFRFIGTENARKCLIGKKIILLGDSMITEQVHDLAILLSGIGNNRSAISNFVSDVNSARSAKYFGLPMNVTVGFHVRPGGIGQRNMTISIPPPIDTFIHHRFMGHWDIQSNYGGIQSFTHPNVTAEVNAMIRGWFGENNNTSKLRPADIVIINSADHDKGHSVNEFATELNKLIPSLQAQNSKMKLIWRGSILHTFSRPYIGAFDAHAQRLCQIYNITYVNSSAAFEIVGREYPNSMLMFTADTIHYGTISLRKKKTNKLTISSLATQMLLHHLC